MYLKVATVMKYSILKHHEQIYFVTLNKMYKIIDSFFLSYAIFCAHMVKFFRSGHRHNIIYIASY